MSVHWCFIAKGGCGKNISSWPTDHTILPYDSAKKRLHKVPIGQLTLGPFEAIISLLASPINTRTQQYPNNTIHQIPPIHTTNPARHGIDAQAYFKYFWVVTLEVPSSCSFVTLKYPLQPWAAFVQQQSDPKERCAEDKVDGCCNCPRQKSLFAAFQANPPQLQWTREPEKNITFSVLEELSCSLRKA